MGMKIHSQNTAWLNHASTTFSAQMHFPIFSEVLHLSKNSCFLSRLKQLSELKKQAPTFVRQTKPVSSSCKFRVTQSEFKLSDHLLSHVEKLKNSSVHCLEFFYTTVR